MELVYQQESLGGNAKTSIIANISPMSLNAQETLSTLLFVKSAKDIRQRCKVNEATNHHAEAMQKELRRLKIELDNLRVQVAEPAARENNTLKDRLKMYDSSGGLLLQKGLSSFLFWRLLILGVMGRVGIGGVECQIFSCMKPQERK